MLGDINKDFHEFKNVHWRNSILGYGNIYVRHNLYNRQIFSVIKGKDFI